MPEAEKPDFAALTVQLLSAYLGNNQVPANQVPELVRATKAALAEDAKHAVPLEAQHVPAVSVKAALHRATASLAISTINPTKA